MSKMQCLLSFPVDNTAPAGQGPLGLYLAVQCQLHDVGPGRSLSTRSLYDSEGHLRPAAPRSVVHSLKVLVVSENGRVATYELGTTLARIGITPVSRYGLENCAGELLVTAVLLSPSKRDCRCYALVFCWYGAPQGSPPALY